MKSTGKKFEDLIKLSASEQSFDFNRMRDAGYRGEVTARRFTIKNICDLTLYKNGKLFYIEAKSSKRSLAFSRLTQHNDLIKKASEQTKGVSCGYLLEIKGLVFFVDVLSMHNLMDSTGKKSVNADDLAEFRINYYLPPRKKKPRINLDELLR